MSYRNTRAWSAYIEQSRGAMPSMLSTDAMLADQVADALMARVGGRFASFTLGPHGPVQWLEGEPPAQAPQHRAERLFTPVQTIPGQLTL